MIQEKPVTKTVRSQKPGWVVRLPKRWPVIGAEVVIGVVYLLLSARLTGGYGWLMLPVAGSLLLAIIVSEEMGHKHISHLIALISDGLVTVVVIATVAALLYTLPSRSLPAEELLYDAALLWLTNIITFAMWYWHMDDNGPYHRHLDPNYIQNSAFIFPQFTRDVPDKDKWRPHFIDYLFVAFNTSTAFSPTDTAIISIRVKLLSMLQSVISLITIGTLLARAVNIL